MSTSCDMENGRRWRGAVGEFEVVTYISPDCGSTIYVSCAKGSSSKSGSTSRCLVDTSGPRMDGTACAGSFSEEVAVEEEGCGGGEEGMDQSLPPVVRLRAWNLPSTEATRTTSRASRGSSSVTECPRGGRKCRPLTPFSRAPRSRRRVTDSGMAATAKPKRRAKSKRDG